MTHPKLIDEPKKIIRHLYLRDLLFIVGIIAIAVYDCDDVTPGRKAKNWAQVFECIQEGLRADRWHHEREAVCRLFNKFRDNRNSERVFSLGACLSNPDVVPERARFPISTSFGSTITRTYS